LAVSAPELFRLRDGRVIEYARYGHPNGLPALFFHGFIGSHHQAAMAAEAAERQGITFFAWNRPGVGRSTPCVRQTIAEIVPDVVEWSAHLGLDRFVVVGASGGVPSALACLARLPERVPLAVLVSGLGPLHEPGALSSMKSHARMALRLGRHCPVLVRWFLARRARLFRRDPVAFLDTVVRSWSPSDQELFTQPRIRAMFLADLEEVLVRGQGHEGLVQQLGLYFRWGFDLEEIPPTSRAIFWHGRHDLLVPAAMSERMARQLPGGECHLRPGGHFMCVEHADEVMQSALAHQRR
jgi:pimeloyl-ACP methyl ester carboxylesterase